MPRLPNRSTDELRAALAEAEGRRPTMRLMVAIAYKGGVNQSDLADWYGLSRKTVYNWLRRFETAPPAEAARDDRRPGRPRELDGDQLARLERTLAGPAAAGVDADRWTPAAVQRYVRKAFGVTYSARTCRRLLAEFGPDDLAERDE